jgi:hypothetical protein
LGSGALYETNLMRWSQFPVLKFILQQNILFQFATRKPTQNAANKFPVLQPNINIEAFTGKSEKLIGIVGASNVSYM